MPDSFVSAREDRWFEDYRQGAVHELGAIEMEAEELVRFAERFDPQPMHVDEAAARRSPSGALIASGWHTAGLVMRLIVDEFLSDVATLPSPGIDKLRWTSPVRAGDTISVRMTILEARPSASKPHLGVVRSLMEARNQRGEPVMTMRAANLFLRRPGASATAGTP